MHFNLACSKLLFFGESLRAHLASSGVVVQPRMADIARPRHSRADWNPAILFKCLWKNKLLIKWVYKIAATDVGTSECLLWRNSTVWNVPISDSQGWKLPA